MTTVPADSAVLPAARSSPARRTASPGFGRAENRDRGAVLPGRLLAGPPPVGPVGVLESEHRVRAGRDWRTGHDAHRLPGTYRTRVAAAGRLFVDDLEPDRVVRAGRGDVGGAQGVPVERRVVMWWNWRRRPNVLGQDHAGGGLQIDFLRAERARQGQHSAECVLDAQQVVHAGPFVGQFKQIKRGPWGRFGTYSRGSLKKGITLGNPYNAT